MRDILDTTISEVRLSAGRQEIRGSSVAAFLHEVEGAASLRLRHGDGRHFRFPQIDQGQGADSQLLASAFFDLLQNASKYSTPMAKWRCVPATMTIGFPSKLKMSAEVFQRRRRSNLRPSARAAEETAPDWALAVRQPKR